MKTKILLSVICAATLFGGCKHKVQFEPSDKPIIIELNINIDQEIRVRLDDDVDNLIADNPDLF